MKVPLRILVVDDNPAVLLTYVLVLEHEGYEVTGAPSYEMACQVLAQRTHDLLLCDFVLDGGRTGLEIIDVAQRQQPALSVVLMTGYTNPEIMDYAQQRGVIVLYKPIEVWELLKVVDSVASATPAALKRLLLVS